MKVLGIDYGEVRTGFAISDDLMLMSQALGTVKIAGSDKLFFKKVMEYVTTYDINIIVIGYPKHMNGMKSEKTDKIDLLVNKLQNILKSNAKQDVKIVKYDERLTTVASHKLMTILNVKKDKKKDIVDTIAAVYILQGYLDSMANKNI